MCLPNNNSMIELIKWVLVIFRYLHTSILSHPSIFFYDVLDVVVSQKSCVGGSPKLLIGLTIAPPNIAYKCSFTSIPGITFQNRNCNFI